MHSQQDIRTAAFALSRGPVLLRGLTKEQAKWARENGAVEHTDGYLDVGANRRHYMADIAQNGF